MGKKVRVKSLEIQLPGGELIALSIEDAKNLREQLNDLFGSDVVVVNKEVVVERNRWPFWVDTRPNRPYLESPGPEVGNMPPKIWCSTQPLHTADHPVNG